MTTDILKRVNKDNVKRKTTVWSNQKLLVHALNVGMILKHQMAVDSISEDLLPKENRKGYVKLICLLKNVHCTINRMYKRGLSPRHCSTFKRGRKTVKDV